MCYREVQRQITSKKSRLQDKVTENTMVTGVYRNLYCNLYLTVAVDKGRIARVCLRGKD